MAAKKNESTPAKSDEALRNSLLGKAGTELKRRHEAEYDEIADALFAEHGLTRKKRKTKEERERELYEQLRAKFEPASEAVAAE